MFKEIIRNKLVLDFFVFVLFYLPLCSSTVINPVTTTPFYHDYNYGIHNNQKYDSISNDNKTKQSSRKPNEYTRFYLNNENQNSFNNLVNYFTNYRAYMQKLYHSSRFPEIKGYNYVNKRSNNLDSLENNLTLPIVYSLNFDRSKSNPF